MRIKVDYAVSSVRGWIELVDWQEVFGGWGGWSDRRLTVMIWFTAACYDLCCQSVLLWQTAEIRSRLNRSVVRRQAHPSLLPEPCLLIYLPVPGHFAGPHISLATRNALLTPLAILTTVKWSKGPIPSLFPVCCSVTDKPWEREMLQSGGFSVSAAHVVLTL